MNEGRRKIAHVMPAATLIGGTEYATLRIIKAVAPFGFDNVVFCLPKAPAIRELFESAGVSVATYHAAEPSYRHPRAYLKESWRLAGKYKQLGIDLVHCADLLSAHRTALAAKLAGIPVICHIRSRYEDISWRDRSFLWPVKKFVFVSRDTWNRFGHSVSSKRGVVVYDGIEVDLAAENATSSPSVRSEFNIPDNAKIVGMVARIARSKDFSTLARAAVHVLRVAPDTRFLIVGGFSETADSKKYFEEVRRTLREAGVDHRFIFTDFRTDVGRLVSAMDVFVLCTHHEGLPLVVLEAMAHRKPVVATAVDGILEVISHGRTGLLHAHQNDLDLSEQIILLLSDDRYAIALGVAGYEFVRDNFNELQFASGIVKVYREAIS